MFESIIRQIFLKMLDINKVAYAPNKFTFGVRIGKLGNTYKTLRPRAVKKYWDNPYSV